MCFSFPFQRVNWHPRHRAFPEPDELPFSDELSCFPKSSRNGAPTNCRAPFLEIFSPGFHFMLKEIATFVSYDGSLNYIEENDLVIRGMPSKIFLESGLKLSSDF